VWLLNALFVKEEEERTAARNRTYDPLPET
jgi:hypothetical protein